MMTTEILTVTITLLVYLSARALQDKTRSLLLNPLMLSIIVLILGLRLSQISYETYASGARFIDFFLKPAVVALGVTLYQQLEKIRRQWLPLLLSQVCGCIAGIVSVIWIGSTLGASREIILSMSPKSVTTPIALEVSRIVGGIPALTAAVVILVGLFGAVFGYGILRLAGIKNPASQSLAIGTAAHALGTSRSMEIGPSFGAMSTTGLILNGILTAILAPYILDLFIYFHWL